MLVGLGSPVAVATFGHHDCPTCQQSLDGLEHQPDLATLDYEKSLDLLTEQARTLRALQEDAERAANDQVLVRTGFEREADDLRREMKAHQGRPSHARQHPIRGGAAAPAAWRRTAGQTSRTSVSRFCQGAERLARSLETFAAPRGPSWDPDQLT